MSEFLLSLRGLTHLLECSLSGLRCAQQQGQTSTLYHFLGHFLSQSN